MQIIGFHGTNKESALRILSEGFIESSEKEWFGSGVYFFETLPKISNGFTEARHWAVNVKKFIDWAVLKASIHSDNVLDLVNSIPHKKIFDEIRYVCLDLHRKSGKAPSEFMELLIFTKLETMGFEVIRCLVDAMKDEGYYSYVVRRPQVQVCVKVKRCIVSIDRAV